MEDFWKYFNYVPLPSAFFSDGTRRFDFVDRSVEGLSLFRSGIEPKWEDPANAEGGEWFFKTRIPLEDLDSCWEDSILALIGETLDPTDKDTVCGIRVVDKSRGSRHVQYRLEVWFRSNDDATVKGEIKKRWIAAMKTGREQRGLRPEDRPIQERSHS